MATRRDCDPRQLQRDLSAVDYRSIRARSTCTRIKVACDKVRLANLEHKVGGGEGQAEKREALQFKEKEILAGK